jgi:type II secretory pathway predicted ATPase ExeA/cell division protein FtsN
VVWIEMYKDHFGLHASPFALGAHLQFLYKSGAFEETMAHLVYGLKGGEDIVLITGGIGTGKTMALHNLVTHISSLYKVALINTTQIGYKELLKMVLVELGVSYPPEADRADLLMIIKGEIEGAASEGKRVLLIVDEAQNLDLDTLEGLRLLTNLAKTKEQALQLVLVGQPGLLDSLDSQELIQLKQRIRVHYHLITLTPNEMKEYIEHRLSVAGCRKVLFNKGAYDKVFRLSKGVPRLVNVIADKSMLKAFVDKSSEIDASHVEDLDYVRSEDRNEKQTEEIKIEPTAEKFEDPVQAPARKSKAKYFVIFILLVSSIWVLSMSPWEYFSNTAEDYPEVIVEKPMIAPVAIDTVITEVVDVKPEVVVEQKKVWPAPSSGMFWVHVGSFQVKENAEKLASKMDKAGFNIAVRVSELAGTSYHQVMTGPAESKDQAQDIAIKAKAEDGVDYTMIKYVR